MAFFDLMSSQHFHVILHSNKVNGLIFNRLDKSVATISYDDAKELENLRKINRIYGIVGKYLNRYLVLIKNRSFVGTICDPKTKKEHDIYVVTQVQVVDIYSPQYSLTHTTPTPLQTTASNTNDNNVNGSKTQTTSQIPITSSNDKQISNKHDPTPETPNAEEAREIEDFSSLPISISSSSYASQSRAWNPFKLANSFKNKIPNQILRTAGLDTVISKQPNNDVSGEPNNSREQVQTESNILLQQQQQIDNADKRLIEEMTKLLNNTNSFYYSPTLDLTRRFSEAESIHETDCLWDSADKRFFWNNYMSTDLIELSKTSKDANLFISVIIQGFVAIENYVVNQASLDSHTDNNDIEDQVEHELTINACLPATSMNRISGTEYQDISSDRKTYKLALVSRRSVFQAGTRYRRRGCDDQGNCANFVETEQIFIYSKHFTSMVILRGSIPLYWYQTGYNYRPPPVLFKSQEENTQAFEKHFEDLMLIYKTKHIISIDCTEQTGREKALHDAYAYHMSKLRSIQPDLKLIEFDFHKHCRGRQCSDTQVEKHLKSCGLTEQIINQARYYWNDGEVVWNQSGVFRVNCLDCSDRTNVVQRAIALQILDIQLSRLGVIAPDTCPEDNEFRRIMQVLWSANGNVLSTQYCGTRALFTGDKKLSGYLKDTYSSASRYYISKFRDAYRQAAIDAMLGVVGEDTNPVDQQTKDVEYNGNPDHCENINLDSQYMARAGSALLKDVGSRMSNRLARLKGRFYVKPQFNLDSIRMSNVEAATDAREAANTINETNLIDNRIGRTLDGLNIDWPSNESLIGPTSSVSQKNIVTMLESTPEHLLPAQSAKEALSAFSQLSASDDNFQDDDEFSQLMLSIDLAELQKLQKKEDATKLNSSNSEDKEDPMVEDVTVTEEIDMTETCPIGSTKNHSSKGPNETTTST